MKTYAFSKTKKGITILSCIDKLPSVKNSKSSKEKIGKNTQNCM